MSKLAIDKLNRKVPPVKPKVVKAVEGAKNAVKKVHKHFGGGAKLERTPKTDTFVSSKNASDPIKQKKHKPVPKNRLGDFYVEQNRKLAEKYIGDLEDGCREIPGASFVKSENTSSSKGLDSTLSKLARGAEKFETCGFNGVVRDGVRATVFIPDADRNYIKIVKVMEKKGYKIADNFAEDADGNLILAKDGTPKMVPDIDVRFGENAQPSGYEDVQLRFEKGGHLYELIILPGLNYKAAKDLEHSLVYEHIRKYKELGLTVDSGASEIVKGIKKEIHAVTKQIYANAKKVDTEGSRNASVVAFTPEGINKLGELFKSLKNLYLGNYSALPPSKRTKPFKQTKNYRNLDEIERGLHKFMELYKPVEK